MLYNKIFNKNEKTVRSHSFDLTVIGMLIILKTMWGELILIGKYELKNFDLLY